MKYIITFATVHYVMKSEKALKQKGLSVRLIPTPRKISSDCGMALEVDKQTLELSELKEIISEADIPEPEGIHIL
jgi:hypothetical protein